MANGEDTYIKNIETAIHKIKNGTIAPKDAKAGVNFRLLKAVNEPMHDELMRKYKVAIEMYNSKKDTNEIK